MIILDGVNLDSKQYEIRSSGAQTIVLPQSQDSTRREHESVNERTPESKGKKDKDYLGDKLRQPFD